MKSKKDKTSVFLYRLYLPLSFLAIFFFCVSCSPTKNISVVSSMDQGWSGGIAGHYGKNYAIKIDLSKFKKQIIPDTIWIEGFYFPLFIDSGKKTGNVKMISDGKISTCIINVGYSVNGTEMHVVPDVSDYHALQNDKPAPVKFSGAALLVFHEKDNPKREFFVIPSIQHAAPINYP